jgi:hypothetical protein
MSTIKGIKYLSEAGFRRSLSFSAMVNWSSSRLKKSDGLVISKSYRPHFRGFTINRGWEYTHLPGFRTTHHHATTCDITAVAFGAWVRHCKRFGGGKLYYIPCKEGIRWLAFQDRRSGTESVSNSGRLRKSCTLGVRESSDKTMPSCSPTWRFPPVAQLDPNQENEKNEPWSWIILAYGLTIQFQPPWYITRSKRTLTSALSSESLVWRGTMGNRTSLIFGSVDLLRWDARLRICTVLGRHSLPNFSVIRCLKLIPSRFRVFCNNQREWNKPCWARIWRQ